MRDIIKGFGLLIVGLIVAIIIYPIAHESGHALFALLVGADEVSIRIFPTPYTVCNIIEVHKFGHIIIGFGGILFPALLSLFTYRKFFWIWYANFVFKLITIWSLLISIISCAMFVCGGPMKNDDITQILTIWPKGYYLSIFSLIIIFTLLVVVTIKEKPFKRCFNYFVRSEKTSAA